MSLDKWVTFQERKFIVRRNDAGKLMIYERVIRNPGHLYLEWVTDVSRFHEDHSPLPKRGLYFNVLRLAGELP